MKKVLAISGKQYSGKDTCADILVPKLKKAYGSCAKFPFARSLKEQFIKEFLPGWTMEELEANKGELRKDLIAFGSNKRATNIDVFCEKILDAPEEVLVVSDLRFVNEYDFLMRHANVYFLRVNALLDTRRTRGNVTCMDDPSETELDHFIFDYFIHNDSTKLSLKQELINKVLPEVREIFDADTYQLKLNLWPASLEG